MWAAPVIVPIVVVVVVYVAPSAPQQMRLVSPGVLVCPSVHQDLERCSAAQRAENRRHMQRTEHGGTYL
jgi:hypothetical protein